MPVVFAPPTATSLGMSTSNQQDIVFARSSSSVGTVSYVALFDALSGGNMLAYSRSEGDPLIIEADVAPAFKSGTIILEYTGNMSVEKKTKDLNFLRGQDLIGFTPYFAPFNGDPESGGAELAGDNYARVQLAYNSPIDITSGGMQILNNSATSNTALSSWGMWTHTAIMDASSAGNVIFNIPRDRPRNVTTNSYFVINENELPLTVN
jgi:hypothetical protein